MLETLKSAFEVRADPCVYVQSVPLTPISSHRALYFRMMQTRAALATPLWTAWTLPQQLC
jgi:hypothetical protein